MMIAELLDLVIYY